jgi:uroporphyrinogen decarboxylase
MTQCKNSMAQVGINGFCGLEEEPHTERTSYQNELGVTYIKNGWPVMVQPHTPLKTRADWERYEMTSHGPAPRMC